MRTFLPADCSLFLTIICMFKLICVTNRALCKGVFLSRIEKIAKSKVDAIILREKDLTEEEYEALAREVLKICDNYGANCVLHNFIRAAINLKATALHLPLAKLREISNEDKSKFKMLGASCHSVSDAVEAEKLGCSYITAGHIFDTDCKKDLPGRGLNFLKKVSEAASIPVYAIGGITPENADKTKNAGAKGVCVMSGFMQCEDVFEYIRKWSEGKS